MTAPAKPLLDLAPLADALTRQALDLSGLWVRCSTCDGDGKLEQSNPHRPLVDCPSCDGRGGWTRSAT